MASDEIVVKVPCTVCGAPILPRTAEKNGGLCMRCKDGWVACSGCGERAARGGPGVAVPLCPRCAERARGTRIDDFLRAHGGGDCALLARFFHLEEQPAEQGRAGGGAARVFREELQQQPWPDVGRRLRELQELRGTVLRF